MTRTVREPRTREERAQAVAVLRELWTDEPRERVAGFLDEPGYHALCAFDDAETTADADATVVGVAGVSVQRALHHERHAWIHDLVVTADRRGDGVGTRLLAAVEDWARARDLDLVALATAADNDAARDFYAENEYDEWGRVHERRP